MSALTRVRPSIVVAAAALTLLTLAGCKNRRAGTLVCTPGEVVAVGCTASIGRICSGDPRLTVCDTASVPDAWDCTTSSAGFLGSSDDGEGLCPRAVVTCPESGSVGVHPEGSGSTWACEFALAALPPTSSIETCTPGEALMIGCNGTVGPTCTGDPTLTVCDASLVPAAESCARDGAGFLAFNDDSGGLCPSVAVTCPASGRIAVDANPFGSGSTSWSCPYVVVPGGVGP